MSLGAGQAGDACGRAARVIYWRMLDCCVGLIEMSWRHQAETIDRVYVLEWDVWRLKWVVHYEDISHPPPGTKTLRYCGAQLSFYNQIWRVFLAWNITLNSSSWTAEWANSLGELWGLQIKVIQLGRCSFELKYGGRLPCWHGSFQFLLN